MYETAASRVDIMEQKFNVRRKWLGLPQIGDTSALNQKIGLMKLPLAAISEIYKAGKVRTVMILRESMDSEIRSNPPAVHSTKIECGRQN